MTIQEKYKYLYDNYKYDRNGFLSEIVLNCLNEEIITRKEFTQITKVYHGGTNPGLSIHGYKYATYSNNIIFTIELLYKKVKAFQDNKG